MVAMCYNQWGYIDLGMGCVLLCMLYLVGMLFCLFVSDYCVLVLIRQYVVCVHVL